MIIIWICIILLAGIGLTVYMIRNAFEDNVHTEVLSFKNLPHSIEGKSLFFISDIHRRKISVELLKKLKQKPDWIVIGGDLAEKGVPYARIADNLSILKEIAPLYFVWGNNDYEVNEEQLRELFVRFDVRELKNEVFELQNEQLSFVGVDDVSTQELPPIESILENVKPDSFQIMFSHNPAILAMLPEDHQLSLILSGHTHGGQIRIFGLGPYQKGSIRERNGTLLLVSNGYGTSLLPLRLGAKPETHLLILKKRPQNVSQNGVATYRMY
ncbi:metallophosphoesterase [Bacillus sp. J14TS2]|uniref:metallophosphoesterase n=1 Tax=Bacillus sp. J14TS2 TaxID=2807188 RepID=UPI001B0FAEBB|nr:metallophosphoesterase [Bacillus sp. J14TS2]GIN73450.1 metallophosphoesterase [Bacillus sp. J14TS2]